MHASFIFLKFTDKLKQSEVAKTRRDTAYPFAGMQYSALNVKFLVETANKAEHAFHVVEVTRIT